MTCPDPVTIIDLGVGDFVKSASGKLHAAPLRRPFGIWKVGETKLVQFTTGNASANLGKISVGGTPVEATFTLSETPCGPPVDAHSQKGGQGTFSYRVGNASSGISGLKPNTQYFLAGTCQQENSGYTVDFTPPNP